MVTRYTEFGETVEAVGGITDPKSLAKDTSTVVALARMAAKQAWKAATHFHGPERWLGLAGAAEAFAPFAIPVDDGGAGAGTFGAWTELLDADDTPIIAGSTYYDPHRILLTDIPLTKQIILLQFAWGAVAATAYGDGDYTEVYAFPEKAATGQAMPINIRFPRLAADTLLWCRGKQNTAVVGDGTIDFLLGIHEYTDPDT